MNISWLRSTKGDLEKVLKALEHAQKQEHPDAFIIESLREIVLDTIKREYPLGARCRICRGTEYDHIIVGHQSGNRPVIQVHPINPLHSNDTFSNWDIKDVHVLGKE